MKFFVVLLAFASALIAFSGLAHALDLGSCADGTAYGSCSTANPGNYCTGSPPALQPYTALCICESVPGWVTEGSGESATCRQAKCDDGTKMGECSASATVGKPKICIGGSTYADNATKCGCPSGKQPSAAGIICEYLPCTDGTKDGQCSTKSVGKKCEQSVLVDRASACPCKLGYTKQGEACVLLCSDGTEAGKCSATKPKECNDNGYLLDNANKCGCPEGQVADPTGKRCVAAGLGGISGSDLLGGGASSGNATSAGSSTPNQGLGLSCCCLPTALIGIAGGFVFFRKRK